MKALLEFFNEQGVAKDIDDSAAIAYVQRVFADVGPFHGAEQRYAETHGAANVFTANSDDHADLTDRGLARESGFGAVEHARFEKAEPGDGGYGGDNGPDRYLRRQRNVRPEQRQQCDQDGAEAKPEHGKTGHKNFDDAECDTQHHPLPCGKCHLSVTPAATIYE